MVSCRTAWAAEMSWRWRSFRDGVGLFLLPGLPIIVTFNDCVGGLARIRGLSMAPALNAGTACYAGQVRLDVYTNADTK